MAYTAWETAANEAMGEVAAYCRHAARGTGATFTTLTVPSLASVERWLTISNLWIKGLLARNGLSTTQTNATVVGILQELNVVDVCMRVEMSLPEESGSGEPNQRFLEFSERRKELTEMITNGSLAELGATAGGNSRAPIIGGESYARKRVAEENTDRTQHRIRRGIFNHPSANLPPSEEDYIA